MKAGNLLIDNCQRDTALLRDCKLDVIGLESSLTDANKVIREQIADIASLERLDSSRVANLTVYRDSFKAEQRKSKVRARLLWIFGAVAVVETVVIGVAVGTR